MKLYLITHAHTQSVPSEDATQWSLSASGAEQAIRLAQQPFWDNVAQIFLSAEAKTRLTIEPVIAQRALPTTVDERFNELQRGREWLSNNGYAERVRQAFAEPSASIGGWETAEAARSRLVAGINELCQKHPQQTCALVGHGLSLSLYRALLLGQSNVNFADWQKLSFAAVALVDPLQKLLLQDFAPVAGYAPRVQ